MRPNSILRIIMIVFLLGIMGDLSTAKPTYLNDDDESETETHLTAEDFLRNPSENAQQHTDADDTNPETGHRRREYGGHRTDPTLGKYFEGDMVLGNTDNHGDAQHDGVAHAALRKRTSRWPDGVVPYAFGSSYDSVQMGKIARAIQDYNDRTCIRWVPRVVGQHRDYVLITKKESGCFSALGQVGEMQVMGLNPECFDDHGTIIHEMMHALGFVHEQSRPDRDDYIELIRQNMKPGPEIQHQFQKYDTDYVDTLGETYDYGSVMHYGRTAFSKDYTSETIRPKRAGGEKIGNRKGFSEKDVRKINKLYECTSVTSKVKTKICKDNHWRCAYYASTMVGYCNRHMRIRYDLCPKSCGTCETEVDTEEQLVDCVDHSHSCAFWAALRHCRSFNRGIREAMQVMCPASCGNCNLDLE